MSGGRFAGLPVPVEPVARAAAGAAVCAVAIGAAALVGSRCLHLTRTRSGLARVRRVEGADGSVVRVLQLGGVFQSATYIDERRFEPVFAYYRAFDAMFKVDDALRARAGHGVRRVLMLGGGGYAYPKHALTSHPELSMDVVEIDPAITRLAQRWFYLDELRRRAGSRLGLITADAREYVARAASASVRYDAVVNDCFSGVEPVRALATVEALRAVRACLVPGGLYLANIVSTCDGACVDFLRDAVATALRVFSCVQVVPCPDELFGGEDNYLLVASDADIALAGALPFDDDFLGSVMHDDPVA